MILSLSAFNHRGHSPRSPKAPTQRLCAEIVLWDRFQLTFSNHIWGLPIFPFQRALWKKKILAVVGLIFGKKHIKNHDAVGWCLEVVHSMIEKCDNNQTSYTTKQEFHMVSYQTHWSPMFIHFLVFHAFPWWGRNLAIAVPEAQLAKIQVMEKCLRCTEMHRGLYFLIVGFLLFCHSHPFKLFWYGFIWFYYGLFLLFNCWGLIVGIVGFSLLVSSFFMFVPFLLPPWNFRAGHFLHVMLYYFFFCFRFVFFISPVHFPTHILFVPLGHPCEDGGSMRLNRSDICQTSHAICPVSSASCIIYVQTKKWILCGWQEFL